MDVSLDSQTVPEVQEGSGKNTYTRVPNERIRNFSIIAHIDHGKSTLADRLLQATGTVDKRDMKEQFLDNMDLERERGITIKLQAARMNYVNPKDGLTYCLQLIDTPGHCDFTYEVSRSLMACEGALLVVDSSQGVEAQTLANVYLALEADLDIIPVLNKIDLPGSEPDRVAREIEEVIGLDCSNIIRASAKTGIGIDDIFQSIIDHIPPPKESNAKTLRALIFDSMYDPYRGVICFFRIVDGELRCGDKIRFMASGKEFFADEVGVMAPARLKVEKLVAGEIGYLIGSIKSVADARVGDTITVAGKHATREPLPGYQQCKPMMFCGVFPIDSDQYPELKDSLEKLKLSDAALSFEVENSSALGFGFRCGFLGMLHADIVQERLSREFNMDVITTAPSVVYRVKPVKGEAYLVDNPADLPEATKREYIEEPYVKLEIITPEEFVGSLMELAQNRRGEFVDMRYLVRGRTTLVYNLPLAELVNDFFDHLKSRSKGYASMEYNFTEFRKDNLVKMDIFLSGDRIDALSCIVHRDKAYSVGKALCKKLKEIVPRAQFKIQIQAVIGAKPIASETISALRKDMLAKCYGGDITRKKKLLKKQAVSIATYFCAFFTNALYHPPHFLTANFAFLCPNSQEGKKRMKSVGRVNVPQDAFKALLSVNDGS